jgi:hypothetical protein
MSIQKEYVKYIPICDICGDMLSPCDSYEDALSAMRESGWDAKRVGFAFENYCPSCILD